MHVGPHQFLLGAEEAYQEESKFLGKWKKINKSAPLLWLGKNILNRRISICMWRILDNFSTASIHNTTNVNEWMKSVKILQNYNCSCVSLQLNLNQVTPRHCEGKFNDFKDTNTQISWENNINFHFFWCFYGKNCQQIANFPKICPFPKNFTFPKKHTYFPTFSHVWNRRPLDKTCYFCLQYTSH